MDLLFVPRLSPPEPRFRARPLRAARPGQAEIRPPRRDARGRAGKRRAVHRRVGCTGCIPSASDHTRAPLAFSTVRSAGNWKQMSTLELFGVSVSESRRCLQK